MIACSRSATAALRAERRENVAGESLSLVVVNGFSQRREDPKI
jgi:hypothetical protein